MHNWSAKKHFEQQHRGDVAAEVLPSNLCGGRPSSSDRGKDALKARALELFSRETGQNMMNTDGAAAEQPTEGASAQVPRAEILNAVLRPK